MHRLVVKGWDGPVLASRLEPVQNYRGSKRRLYTILGPSYKIYRRLAGVARAIRDLVTGKQHFGRALQLLLRGVVGPRCVRLVCQELEQLDLTVLDVGLGGADVAFPDS